MHRKVNDGRWLEKTWANCGRGSGVICWRIIWSVNGINRHGYRSRLLS